MIVIVCSALVRQGDSVLFVQETKQIARGKYGLPGGKLETGETLEECVVREVKEETGLDVQVEALLAVIHKPTTHEDNTVMKFVFGASLLSDRHDKGEMEPQWLSMADITALDSKNLIRGKEVAGIVRSYVDDKLPPLPTPTVVD